MKKVRVLFLVWKDQICLFPHTLVRCGIEVYGRDSTGRELERRQLHDTWGGRPRVFVVSQCWVLAMWAWSQFPACTGTTHQEPALIDTVTIMKLQAHALAS